MVGYGTALALLTGAAAVSSVPPAFSRPVAGGGFAPCEALWRRVAGVSEAWMTSFPPVGGGAAALRGGVAAKVQTHWMKVAENGLFWLNGSHFGGFAVCRGVLFAREPLNMRVNPLIRT